MKKRERRLKKTIKYTSFCYNIGVLFMLTIKQKQLFNEIVDKILASITLVNNSIDKLWIKEAHKSPRAACLLYLNAMATRVKLTKNN